MPRSARLVYRTHAEVPVLGLPLSLSARTETTWKLESGRYDCRLRTDTVEFDQHSAGEVAPARGLVPTHYDQKRPMKAAEAVTIDWARRRLEPAPEGPGPFELEDGAQDRLSLQFQLAWMHERDPERFRPGAVLPFQIIGPRGADRWDFHVDAAQPLRTGIGTVAAVRLHARRMAGDREETMEMWISDAAQGFPLRIRMVDRNRSVIDSTLDEATFE
jgi:hypothetical protein